MAAHRVSYYVHKGQLTEGLVIDHVCKNRKCVNPLHLREVTIRENVTTNSDVAVKKTIDNKCKNGHSYDTENTLIIKNGRRCRACYVAAQKKFQEKYKEIKGLLK